MPHLDLMNSMPSIALSLCLIVLCGAAAARDDSPAPVAGGIWKAAIPRQPMHGQFENMDPMGLAGGARILADCSLNWVSPDTGKLYCFVSGTSLVYFLQSPGANIKSAEAAWIGMHQRP